MTTTRRVKVGAAAAALALAVGLVAGNAMANQDWGQRTQSDIAHHSEQLFGVRSGLPSSSTDDLDAATATAHPDQLFQLAPGLHARVLTSTTEAGKVAAANVDMIALWPNATNPTHLVFCNEQGSSNPGVQRLDLATGAVATILTGTTSCDPMHITAWGTLVFGEEAGDGHLLELIDPVDTTGVVYDRATGTLSGADAGHVAVRDALGNLAYEGVALYDNGVAYYGDENRPLQGNPGGAMYKFVPDQPWTGSGAIDDLTQSPLASGSVYGLRLGLHGASHNDYGQASETGKGVWIPLSTGPDFPDLRTAAANNHLTGFYRPEDIAIDDMAAQAGNVRFCGPETGNEDENENFGKVLCITDGTVADATAGTAVPEVQVLVEGNPQLAMPDNIAQQPGRGNWIVHEDGEVFYDAILGTVHNNDLWDCLDDGSDDNLQSDGCIRIATLRDLDAEWTGGVFDATGTHFYVSVQHNSSGAGVILDITAWT